jgi:hypothetical protein
VVAKVDNERCFCQPVVDSSEMQHVKAKLNEYVVAAFDEGFKKLNFIVSKSKMLFDKNIADKDVIKNHVDFQPISKKDGQEFSKQLVHEIKIRLSHDRKHKARLAELLVMTNEDKIIHLKEMAAEEEKVLLAKTTVKRYELKRDLAVALAVDKLVPCILHMKLRVTEKVFHGLINSGLERYGDSLQDCQQRNLFDTTISEIIQKEVLGNIECGRATQFTFNWSKGNRSVEKASFTGPACDKILVGLKNACNEHIRQKYGCVQ